MLAGQWRELVLGRPDLYLKVRLTAFASVFLTPQIDECVPVFVGVSGPQPWMGWLHIPEREDATDHLLRVYGEALVHTPLFSHLAFALAALAALALLLRRREPADIAMAGLLAAALLFTASFLVLSIACDYRYLYLLDVSAVAAALNLAAGWRPRLRPDRSA